MQGTDKQPEDSQRLDKDQLASKVGILFGRYLKKRVIWRGVEEVGEIKRNLDKNVLSQFMK